jgi:hypothetical protein
MKQILLNKIIVQDFRRSSMTKIFLNFHLKEAYNYPANFRSVTLHCMFFYLPMNVVPSADLNNILLTCYIELHKRNCS